MSRGPQRVSEVQVMGGNFKLLTIPAGLCTSPNSHPPICDSDEPVQHPELHCAAPCMDCSHHVYNLQRIISAIAGNSSFSLLLPALLSEHYSFRL